MNNKNVIGIAFAQDGDDTTMWHICLRNDSGRLAFGMVKGNEAGIAEVLQKQIKDNDASVLAIYNTPEHDNLISDVMNELDFSTMNVITVFDAVGKNTFDLLKDEKYRSVFSRLQNEDRQYKWAMCFALTACIQMGIPLQEPEVAVTEPVTDRWPSWKQWLLGTLIGLLACVTAKINFGMAVDIYSLPYPFIFLPTAISNILAIWLYKLFSKWPQK